MGLPKLERFDLNQSQCQHEDGDECGAEMKSAANGDYVLWDDVQSMLADLNGSLSDLVIDQCNEFSDRLRKAVDNEF
jgi:hypothetical protein